MEKHVQLKIVHHKVSTMLYSVQNLKIRAAEHCKVIIGRNHIEANANTVAIQLPGNPAAYIGKCFTPY